MTAFRAGEVITEFTADLVSLKRGAKEAPKILAQSGKDGGKSLKKGLGAKKIGQEAGKDVGRGFKARQLGKDIGEKMGRAAKSGFKTGIKGIGVGAIGAVATGAALGVIVKRSLDAAKEIRNLSNISGVQADRFQELAFGADKYGISQEKLADTLKDTNDKFSDFFQTGAGPVADFFEQIAPKVGLTEDAFRGLSSDQALGKYVKGLEDANLNQEEMTFYMEAIASDSTALLPLLRNNGAEMNNLATQANNLGVVMSNSLVAQGASAADTLDKLSRTIKGNVTRSIVQAAPQIEAFTNQIIDLIPSIIGWASAAIEGFSDLVEGIESVHDAWNASFLGAGNAERLPTSSKAIEKRLSELRDLEKATIRANQTGLKSLFGTAFPDPLENPVGKGTTPSELQNRLGVNIFGKDVFESIKKDSAALFKLINQQEKKLQAELDRLNGVVATGRNDSDSTNRSSTPSTARASSGPTFTQRQAAKDAQDKEVQEFKRRAQIAQQALAARIQEANALFEASRTPQEQYIARLTELAAVENDVFLGAAAGGPEAFSRLRVQALEEMANASGDYEDALSQLIDANNQGLVSAEDFGKGFQALTDEIEPAGASLERLAQLSQGGVLNAQSTAQARDAIKDSADYLDDITESKLAALELQAREIDGELILAELRGSEVDIEGLERRLAIINETIDLINQGVDPDSAQKDAAVFVDAQDEARAQGQFKNVFKGAFRAALDGNFESFLSNKLKNAASNMFDRALDSLLDGVLSGLAGAFGGSGSGLGALFAGFFADGGVIGAGKFGVVGENGPELISAGSGSLRITPPEDLRLEQFSGFSTSGLESRVSSQPSNVVMNVQGVSDLGSFVKSQGTIEADMAAALRRAQADF